jgi:hypothetical protein
MTNCSSLEFRLGTLGKILVHGFLCCEDRVLLYQRTGLLRLMTMPVLI